MLESAQNVDFQKKAEIGAGNGGVVHLVRHRASGLEMARKVSIWVPYVKVSLL